jgi:hypothetical protein
MLEWFRNPFKVTFTLLALVWFAATHRYQEGIFSVWANAQTEKSP